MLKNQKRLAANTFKILVLLFIAHTNPATAGRYENQQRGFSCVGPGAGWEISEDANGAQWFTEDRSMILTARFVMDIPVEITSEYLDKLYEGFDSDTNTELVESRRGTLNGYHAYFATRRHKNVTTNITYLIAGQRGYMLNFTASEIDHMKYGQIYEQLVTSFHAQPVDTPEAAEKNQQQASERSPTAPPLPHLFRGRGLGFTVNYPRGWEAERVDDTTVQILGPGNADGGRIEALIMVQGHPGEGTTPELLMEKLKAQIAGDYPKAKFYPVKNLILADGLLAGQQCVAEFYEGWEHRRQWQGIMRKQDGTYIAMFILGPLELMEANISNLNTIINSLSPTR